MTAPRVFVSYSHDSEAHSLRVLELCNQLRQDGVDARIDRYETEPAGGWSRWMIRELEAANYVLIICTDTYRQLFVEEAGSGHGVRWV